MKDSLRLSCISVPGSFGRAAKLWIPDVLLKLAKDGRDYVHIQVRPDLARITLGFVRGPEVGYKLKTDQTVISRSVQDELNLKLGQRLALTLVEIDHDHHRAVFEGDPIWFQKQTSRFFT